MNKQQQQGHSYEKLQMRCRCPGEKCLKNSTASIATCVHESQNLMWPTDAHSVQPIAVQRRRLIMHAVVIGIQLQCSEPVLWWRRRRIVVRRMLCQTQTQSCNRAPSDIVANYTFIPSIAVLMWALLCLQLLPVRQIKIRTYKRYITDRTIISYSHRNNQH